MVIDGLGIVNFIQYFYYSDIITMTLKTFWTIFIKIFGLYLIWQTLIILPSYFFSITYFSLLEKILHKNPYDKLFFIVASAMILILVLFVLIIRYCIFQTDRVIEKLHLERGFIEEKVRINIEPSTLLTIAIIVLGGLILADSLPSLVREVFSYLQRAGRSHANEEIPYIVSSLFKIFLGYFMITKGTLIVNFIERKRKNKVVKSDDGIE